MLSEEHLFQAMSAAGVRGRNIVYVSVPITSGQRGFALLRELGLRSTDALDEHQRARWRREVLEANEADALELADRIRRAGWVSPDHVVVDPSRMSVEGWDQDDYNRFWVRLMADHVGVLVATPGWEFSRGARTEVGYAITFGPDALRVVDTSGREIDATELRAAAEAARSSLADDGWSHAEVDTFLPPLAECRPDLSPSAQSQAFNWLVAERRFQVKQFGSAQDDARLVAAGLDPEGWWSGRLAMYLERVRQGDLADDATRVELAKLAATALALLESAIRVYGPVPRPSSSSEA